MSVISVIEDWKGLTSRTDATGRTAPRTFDIVFDSHDDPIARPILAKTARDPDTKISIPPRGTRHPHDRGMYVQTIFAEPKEGPFHFKVTCIYSTKSSSGGGQGAENPLKKKPEIEWDFNVTSERIDRAIALVKTNGGRVENIAITNSAGQSFDPPISDDIYDLALRYARNERNFDPIKAVEYIDHVNSNTFLKAPPGMVKCTVFKGTKVYDDEFGDYYAVFYEFQFRLQKVKGKRYGWLRRILDEGYYKEDGTNNDGTPKLVPIKDDDVNPVTVPVKLDGSGGIKKSSADDVFLTYETKPSVSFSPLNIEIV